jgi:hypothetical protein
MEVLCCLMQVLYVKSHVGLLETMVQSQNRQQFQYRWHEDVAEIFYSTQKEKSQILY